MIIIDYGKAPIALNCRCFYFTSIRKDNEMKNTLKAVLVAVLVFAFTNVAVKGIS